MAARAVGINKSFEVGLPDAMGSAMPPNGAHVPAEIPSTPPGLAALFRACRDIYPDQPNPLQVTALVKCWLGGPDPLDYISMYSNPGYPLTDCAPHWHYISFGMSDLHGDGRVHARNVGGDACNQPSGFGFELTFRLKSSDSDVTPPTWPAAIMQALARYVFKFRNLFCIGDHVSWNCPIDGSGTALHHFLLAEDPQLGTVRTPYGAVQFLQLVGITQDELEAAQHWNGPEMLSIIRRVIGCGGDWLVTDPQRSSIFDTDSSTRADVDAGIMRDGSNLSGVSAQCCWCEMDLPTLSRCSIAASNSVTMASIGGTGEGGAASGQHSSGIDALTGSMSSMMISQDADAARGAVGMRSISLQESEQIKNILRKGLSSSASVDASKKSKVSSEELLRRSATGRSVGEFIGGNLESTAKSLELIHSKYLEGVHLCFNFEAGSLLPSAIRGRVMHGRHFTFQGMPAAHDDSTVIGGNVITFVSEKVKGTWASRSHPYAARGTWLHVCLSPALAQKMFEDVNAVVSMSREQQILPITLEWPEEKITVTLLRDER